MSEDSGQITEYGFEWGPMTVRRAAWFPEQGRALFVETDRVKVELWVSDKGRKIRVWRDDQELT